MRDLMTDLRAANPLNQGGGGRPFSKQDRSRFLDVLEREVRRAKLMKRLGNEWKRHKGKYVKSIMPSFFVLQRHSRLASLQT